MRDVSYYAIRMTNDLLAIGGLESRMREGCRDVGETTKVGIQSKYGVSFTEEKRLEPEEWCNQKNSQWRVIVLIQT